MATEKPLVIGYSGSLAFYGENDRPVKGNSLRNWFWTYNRCVTDPTTRSASSLFRALKIMKEKHGITAADIRLSLWGKIDPRYRKLAESLEISELVQIDGYLSKQESLDRNAVCDLLFLPMESATEFGKPLFIPGKAFEYMKTGKPVLALSGPCDCLDILRPSGLLIPFNPHDSEGIAACLSNFINDRQQLSAFRPNEDYIKNYSFRNITGKLAGIFDELLDHDN